ncbi:gamma-glutamyl-gamma-aminobutyrate hydrolase family protein [Arthrobacter sp. AL12]|uniref:gamma-glutamyl-gamma-aminobutyrate hydrolase family protein n=1 Tax=Arthrobacter sp. AL12 TaxID=3042241 RepID=UPI002499FDFE|nr:gamma-glutamyl-gamma-aminobutyrate hydrolase family protein [Arthrobacter sp. AL12]MDI3212677.1 gamma-glutamyl-gamma-aminobutyrate hydrolase family protein [Arthrobacter sp. AL12]
MQIPPLARSIRPRIGIPVRLSSSTDPDPRVTEANALFDYIVELVRDGGGEPVLLTAPGEPLEALDGVVLPGGGDLDPRLYGEEPGAACYDVSHAQDELDLAIARRSIDAGLPVFGVCRGHQLLNVLYGGTLIQDMDPGTVAHREPNPAHGAGPWAWHEVQVQGWSKVSSLYGGGFGRTVDGGNGDWGPGNGSTVGDAGTPDRGASHAVAVKIASGHHQAVARVADGLVVTAVAEDGTVEALEDPQRWVASVQWHPEALELPAEERLAPFRAFVEVCRRSPLA